MIKVENTSPDCSLSFAPAKPELWKVDLRPHLIKALPMCLNREPVAIPPSSMTWSTYFKHWGLEHSQEESGALNFWGVSQNLYCTCRVQGDRMSGKCIKVFPRVPREELLRASQLEIPGMYLNRHLPPGLLLSEAGWHGTEAFPKYQLEFLTSGAWDIHHLAQHPPEGQVMQTQAEKHNLKVEVDLNMTTVPKVYFCPSRKGFCCHCCCPYMELVFWSSLSGSISMPGRFA